MAGVSVITYNLGNLWRRLVLPKRIDKWSLTRTAFRLRDSLHLVLSMRAVLNIRLQHGSFTWSSRNHPTSHEASGPDLDCETIR